jgi:hypothetical protein
MKVKPMGMLQQARNLVDQFAGFLKDKKYVRL